MKLALAIIVKDELEQVKGILNKYAAFFSEIVLAVDYRFDDFCALKDAFHQLEVYQYQWINDFSHKRNWLAEKVKSPYYFRMDTDDDIKNPENISSVFNKMLLNNIDIVYFHYNYSRDTDGNVDAGHWRETIIKKRADIYWKKAIHENLFIEDQNTFRGVRDNSVEIIHNITPEHALKSQQRNWEILLDEYRRDGENTDPRTVAYIGRMLVGVGRYKEAIKFLELLVAKSGWDDDKYFAFVHMSQCHHNLGDMDNAIACCNEALAINTKWPDVYNRLGEIYIEKKEYQKAVDWLEIGVKKEKPETMFVLDLGVYAYRIKMNLALAYFGLGDYEKAWEYLNISKKAAPNNDFIKSNEKLFREGFENDKYMKNLSWIVAYTRDNDAAKLPKLVEAIPKTMMRDERIMVLRNKYGTPKQWDEKSIVIYCGPAWEDWAAPSVLTGIGGSEEAVVYVSRELTKLGYSVTVFCSCGELAGTYEGVRYEEYFNFNSNDDFNIIIGWRHNIFTGSISAKHKVIWLHDVPSDDMFPLESINNFDKVLVLSEFHKTLLPKWVPEDKILVSANGVNIKDFDNILLERKPHRLIYTSSYDRGLQHILSIWGDIKAEVPDAELHVFYGWNTYDAMVAKGVRSPDFKNAMVKMMQQPGVFEHGRIGHKQLAREFAQSGIYAYPSHFEEISCCVGDTPVLMPRDHQKYPYGVPIKELVGKSGFYVYSYDHNLGKIVLGKVKWVAKTRENAELLKITLDDGTILRFTPDHKFMLRNGEYKEAQYLSIGESLMPCYERPTFAIKQPSGDWEFEHRILGEELLCRSMWDKINEMSSEDREKWCRARYEKKKLSLISQGKPLNNHKIISIEKDLIREDVYDMEVEEYHNFAAAGVFVHNCISAMKAQVAGCIPVVTDYAALAETVKEGIKIHGRADQCLDEYKKALINLMKNEGLQENLRAKVLANRDIFSWAKVAEGWHDNIFRK